MSALRSFANKNGQLLARLLLFRLTLRFGKRIQVVGNALRQAADITARDEEGVIFWFGLLMS